MRVCARVLAAALMTGAIAGAFALPSLVGQGVEEPRALPAPPSVKQRTLHLPVPKAPPQHRITVRQHVAHHAARPALIAVRIAPAKVHRTVFHSAASAHRSGPPSRKPAPGPEPKPTPAPAPAPAQAPAPAPSPAPSTPPERALASTSQPATTPAPPVARPAGSDDDDSGHGKGHAYGHDKQADDDGPGQSNGNGHGNGNDGKGKGHKK